MSVSIVKMEQPIRSRKILILHGIRFMREFLLVRTQQRYPKERIRQKIKIVGSGYNYRYSAIGIKGFSVHTLGCRVHQRRIKSGFSHGFVSILNQQKLLIGSIFFHQSHPIRDESLYRCFTLYLLVLKLYFPVYLNFYLQNGYPEKKKIELEDGTFNFECEFPGCGEEFYNRTARLNNNPTIIKG